jgi:hypothetical protein
MTAARYKLLGKYRTPTFRYGQRVEDQRRGEVRIVGLSCGRIPWPIGQQGKARSLVLYRDLAKAVRRESNLAVCYWWGVGPSAVRKWRRALSVPVNNEGTRARRVAYGKSPAHRKTMVAMFAAEWSPSRRAKIGNARRGKPRAAHVLAALLRAHKGRRMSLEQRRKLSEVHKRRGTRPPWLNPIVAALGGPTLLEAPCGGGCQADRAGDGGRLLAAGDSRRARRADEGPAAEGRAIPIG